ncbi:N-acetylglucosaminyldiphosphoundecaprenol N-acetyl-beta-D-mannosaminyltransferase [Bryocella elongata]|uniref:N-acetylglucosaminyldiphosphoundecaprenol N-acetyl-beta-D-mannosaminyltransferase n=1 Tax=Bryocella elongata TaxID=863522 RepID=A0A1H5SR66_9BACT|nr:WecB/TagA/CpsF family glycosyltransferase [Bryocella elongata]SEF53103.1 N-acetylglucosaminyldiphosphoundecaprenol N-acetyl-beta-D-mannosaminyltransferase [Bryocella elongata]
MTHEHSSPSRANVLGIGISVVRMPDAVGRVTQLIRSGGKGYVCVTGVHGIMEAQRDTALRSILNRSFLTLPDGMPTVWVGRHQGFSMEQVSGPDFMIRMCQDGVANGLRHFLYGGDVGVAERLREALCERIPGLQIVGVYTPPFRPLTSDELSHVQDMIDDCQPDVMWIGLSTPKQERFMEEFVGYLNAGVLVGVGAAFDFHTGRIKDAPRWVKKIGMQWLHRLSQDRRRLWRRYLTNNPRFVYHILLQCLGVQRRALDVKEGAAIDHA